MEATRVGRAVPFTEEPSIVRPVCVGQPAESLCSEDAAALSRAQASCRPVARSVAWASRPPHPSVRCPCSSCGISATCNAASSHGEDMMRLTMVSLFCCDSRSLRAPPVRLPRRRWEGAAQNPGPRSAAVVDLAQDSAGAWTGSMIHHRARHQGRAAVEHRRDRVRPSPLTSRTRLAAPPYGRQLQGDIGGQRDGRRDAPGRQRGEIRADESRAGAGRVAAAQHAGRARARLPMERRVRARRLPATT